MTRNLRLVAPIFSAIIAFAASSAPVRAWDKFAHIVVAQIAYDRMTPAARKEADRLIGVFAKDPDAVAAFDQYKPYTFVTAAAWMDDMRGWNKTYNTWHYIDLPIGDKRPESVDDVRVYKDENSSNVCDALENKCLPALRSKSSTDAEKARALAMLLHLAGDIHQPLHAVGVAAGGNRIAIVELPSADPNWRVTNLHAFWDNAYRYENKAGSVAIAVPFSDLPRTALPIGSGVAKELASRFEAEDAPGADDVAETRPAAWALESNRIAADFAIPASDAPSPWTVTPEYAAKASDISRHRLALAGWRIAAILNDAFGGQ